jgi:hypothetical protein
MTDMGTASLHPVSDFRRARRRAFREDLRCLLIKCPVNLLPFDAVRESLHLTRYSYRDLQSISLDSIVGSVGRYHDFTRHFWPRQDALRDRWARIAYLMIWESGLPPIYLYQVDKAYFVRDGNHRVSVARYLGAPTIEAYVWEFHTRVPLRLDTRLEDLLLKEELVTFLEHTDLDCVRPRQQVVFTVPGSYRVLEEHISAHRYWLESRHGNRVTVTEAVGSWYDLVYTPVVEVVRERNLQRYFPRATETDIYLGILNHHRCLVCSLEQPVSLDQTIEDYVDLCSPNPRYRVLRLLRYRLGGERRPPVPTPSPVAVTTTGDVP